MTKNIKRKKKKKRKEKKTTKQNVNDQLKTPVDNGSGHDTVVARVVVVAGVNR